MSEPKENLFFDLHVHPSLKAGLSKDKKHSAWEFISINEHRARGFKILLAVLVVLITAIIYILYLNSNNINKYTLTGIILFLLISFVIKYTSLTRIIGLVIDIFRLPTYKIRQMINSQANLTQLDNTCNVVVAALIAMERAFAYSTVYRAIGLISPLDGEIMRKIRKSEITPFQLLNNDLNCLLKSKGIKIANKFSDIKSGELYLILSVEGAHSFEENDQYDSILNNFYTFKNQYRLHHLTLAHLTAQPACVHSLGVRVKIGNYDTIRRRGFRPDSTKLGISPLGKAIICMAYADPERPVLIDVKHMSFVSRIQFYEIRKNKTAAKWNEIPIIASHVGVTGISFKEAKITKIRYGKKEGHCDEVIWDKQETALGTYLNPWTINLFDEDIEEILASSGLIGIILDERVIGFGKLIGEFMSKKEVAFLNLKCKIVSPDETTVEYDIDLSSLDTSIDCEENKGCDDTNIAPLVNYKSPNDWLPDPPQQPSEIRQMIGNDLTHIDYIAGNIIHIIKVGYKKYPGGQINHKVHVLDCICIGSDLDGIIDASNFRNKKSRPIDQHDWVTVDKYSRLKSDLETSLNRYLQIDTYFRDNNIFINMADFCDKLFYKNGLKFLQKNFN